MAQVFGRGFPVVPRITGLPRFFRPGGEEFTTVLPSTVPSASGRPAGNHLFYAVNSGRWWLLWVNAADDATLRSAWSTDLLTWTMGDTTTLAKGLTDGFEFAVAYKSIASTDVVHIGYGRRISQTSHHEYHLRATISGTTIVFGTSAEIGTGTTNDDTGIAYTDGVSLCFDSANKIYHLSTNIDSSTFTGNASEAISSNADLGSSWTPGFTAVTTHEVAVSLVWSTANFDLGGGAVLTLFDNGAANTTWTDLRWSKWTGTWSAAANVFGSTSTQDANDWGAVARTTTDVHVVRRLTATTYEHRRFNGTAWSAGQAIPTQANKATAGVFLTSNGTDVWMFVIDSDGANTVRYCKWASASSTWGAWTAHETSTQVRTSISGARTVGANSAATLGICWTEAAGTAFQIVAKPLLTAGVICVNDFDGGGTAGATVTTSNAGAAGDTQFNAVTIGTGAAVTLDSTHAQSGTLALKCNAGTTPADAGVEWSTAAGTQSDWYTRAYYYATTNPVSHHRIFDAVTAGGAALCSGVMHHTDGTLILLNGGFGIAAQTTTPITLNQWIRIETRMIGSATVGYVELRLFNSPNSTTPTETISASSQNTSGAAVIYRYGLHGDTYDASRTIWLDDIATSNQGWIGPATVTSSADATLTATAGITAAASSVKSADATLAATGTLAAAASLTKSIDSTLTATATITAAAGVVKPIDATLTATAALTTAASLVKSVDASLTETATITAAASVAGTKTCDATLTATAAIAAAASLIKSVDASLTTTATMTAAASAVKSADSTLSGTVTISPAGASTKPVASTLTGTASITPAGASTKPVDAALSGTAAIATAGASTKSVDATLAVIGTFGADAVDVPPGKAIDGTLTGNVTITAAASLIKSSGAAVTTTAAIAAAGASTKPVDSTLTATATLTGTETSTKPASSTAAFTAAITAAASVVKSIDSTLASTATITAGAGSGAVQSATAALTGTATLASIASLIKSADAIMVGVAACSGAAVAVKPVPATLTTAATITATLSSVQAAGAVLTVAAVVAATADATPSITGRPNTGTTARPNTGTTARQNAGSTTRPNTGITHRPNTGTTAY